MQMGQKNIRLLNIRTQFPKSRRKCLPAGLLPEARIDQKPGIFPFQKIAVQLPQRIPGQFHPDSPDILIYLFRHSSPFLFRVPVVLNHSVPDRRAQEALPVLHLSVSGILPEKGSHPAAVSPWRSASDKRHSFPWPGTSV